MRRQGSPASWDKKALAEAQKANHRCSKCQPKNRLLVPKKNPRGRFWGCSGYPECQHIEASLSEQKGGKKPSSRAKS